VATECFRYILSYDMRFCAGTFGVMAKSVVGGRNADIQLVKCADGFSCRIAHSATGIVSGQSSYPGNDDGRSVGDYRGVDGDAGGLRICASRRFAWPDMRVLLHAYLVVRIVGGDEDAQGLRFGDAWDLRRKFLIGAGFGDFVFSRSAGIGFGVGAC